MLARNRELGRKYGVEYAEAFHYIGPAAPAPSKRTFSNMPSGRNNVAKNAQVAFPRPIRHASGTSFARLKR